MAELKRCSTFLYLEFMLPCIWSFCLWWELVFEMKYQAVILILLKECEYPGK